MLGLRTRAPETPSEAPADTSQPPTKPAPTRTRQAVILLLTVAATLLWAWLVTLVLDASNWPDALRALRDPTRQPPALLPSIAVVWVVVLLVLALVGRLWLALGIVTAITAVVGVVNTTKLDLRNDPVYPSDVAFLSQPGFLFEMVSRDKLILGAVGLVLLVVGAWAFGLLVGRFAPNLARSASKRGLLALRLTRVLVVVLCLALLWVAGNFNEHGNPWRAAFDSTGLRWRTWDQRVNYQKNGFVSGVLYNTHVTAMAEPRDYSRAEVAQVAERYRALAASMNKGRTGSLDHTNVVTILSESFSNPAWLKTVKFPTDVIPKTTAAMQHTVSGKMLAPGFGSGTANTEYELLTGQSLSQLSPQLSVPFEQMVSHYKEYPSAVGWLRERGHVPIAIHPFSPRMYARPAVYDAFGFDTFITKDQMKNKGRGGGRFIDDKSAFDEVLGQIRGHQQPVLTHLVTMQNHMPYGGQYDDPIKPTSGLPPQYANLAGQYARGIARTDEELADFLATLKDSPEPTAVVFYGDHLPPQVYPQSLVAREGIRTAHETPFLIWSNKAQLKHTELPTTSPTQFLPKLFDALDVPIPPWYALLDSLDKQVPAMDTGIAIDAQNQRVKPSELDPAARKVLADYRLIQYDLSVGKRYSEKIMFGDAPTG